MATAMANERALIRGAVVRMRARIMAVVFGTVGGTGVFVATAWLVLLAGVALLINRKRAKRLP